MGFKTTFTRLGFAETEKIPEDKGSVTVEGNLLVNGDITLTSSIINGGDLASHHLLTDVTASINGVTVCNTATPNYVLTGTISDGSIVAITASMAPNFHLYSFFRATVRHPVTNRVIFTKAVNNHSTYVLGSSASIDFTNVCDNNFSSVNMTVSVTCSNNSMIYSLQSSTGSNYPYTLLCSVSQYSFD